MLTVWKCQNTDDEEEGNDQNEPHPEITVRVSIVSANKGRLATVKRGTEIFTQHTQPAGGGQQQQWRHAPTIVNETLLLVLWLTLAEVNGLGGGKNERTLKCERCVDATPTARLTPAAGKVLFVRATIEPRLEIHSGSDGFGLSGSAVRVITRHVSATFIQRSLHSGEPGYT